MDPTPKPTPGRGKPERVAVTVIRPVVPAPPEIRVTLLDQLPPRPPGPPSGAVPSAIGPANGRHLARRPRRSRGWVAPLVVALLILAWFALDAAAAHVGTEHGRWLCR